MYRKQLVLRATEMDSMEGFRTLRSLVHTATFPLRRVVQWRSRVVANQAVVSELSQFVSSQGKDFAWRLLTSVDPGRVVSLQSFATHLKKLDQPVKRVGVVSGSPNDPELRFFSSLSDIEFMEFSRDPDLFDLCKDWRKPRWEQYHGRFDFVLCSQVLEHLIDPGRAIINLALLLRPGGQLHLNVPAINNRHDSPFFFAGFSEEAIASWTASAGLLEVKVASWKSDKGSRMYSTCDWAPLAVSGPSAFFFLALRVSEAKLKVAVSLGLKRLRHHLKYPCQSLFQAAPSRNAVVVWAFAQASKP